MYLTIAKLVFALFIVGKISCKLDENENSQFEGSLASHAGDKAAAVAALEVANANDVEQLIRKYLKLKTLLERIAESSEEGSGRPEEEYFASFRQPAATSYDRFFKRASVSDGAAYERYIKGKRVNKNMFSSGLQGVWGVPGRR